MLKIELTLFRDGHKPETRTYEGNEGAALMALMDADDHIQAGHWCMLDNGRSANMLTRRLFGRDGALC